MKTISHSITMACLLTVFAAVGCTARTTEEPKKTKSVASASSTDPADEEGAADKISCNVDADCDSDERCVNALCAGTDGDRE